MSLQDLNKICYCMNDVSRHTAVYGCRVCALYPHCGTTTDSTAAVYARGINLKGNKIK